MKAFLNSAAAIILISLAHLPGCGVNDENSKIIPSEGKIVVEIREEYEDFNAVSAPSVYIKLRTEKIYGCYNYGISTSYNVENNVIEIFINGIVVPEICLDALGPAQTRIKVNLSEGEYLVRFRTADFINEYNLTLNSGFIRIDGDTTQNTSLAYRQFNRYPEKTFAYLCGTSSNDSSLCSRFIDTLKSVIKIQSYEFPETGVIPYPPATQGFYYNMAPQYYSYESEGDYDKIGGIMKSFKNSYQLESSYLYTINWMNKSFSSTGL